MTEAQQPPSDEPTTPQQLGPKRLLRRSPKLAMRAVNDAVVDAETATTSTQLVIMRGWQEPNAYAVARPTPVPTRNDRRAKPSRWRAQILSALLLLSFVGASTLIGAWVYRFAPWAGSTTQQVTNASQATASTDAIVLPLPDEAIIARAIVKPLRYAQLGFSIDGRVKERLVQEGMQVAAGQALVRLEDTRQLVALAQARAGLQQAEAQLSGLRAGARVQEIAEAQAVVEEAQARLRLLQQENEQTADASAAQAVLTAAEAKLQQLQGGPTEAALIDVRAALQQAAASLQTAQSAYDQVSWRNDVAMLPEALQLQQATIAYEAAKARYDQLMAGADQAQLSAAQAEIETARANLVRLRTPAKAGELEAAAAQVRQAQAKLDLLTAGAPAATIAAAEATVTAAQATLMAAEAELAETALHAPFAGTVAELHGEVGEQLQAGAPLVQLGDLAAWQLETDDLVELDVVKVQAGALVTITIDALPGVALTGHVVRIKPLGENKVGDMTYTAYIQLDQAQESLAWNMTATVYIEPRRAVKSR